MSVAGDRNGKAEVFAVSVACFITHAHDFGFGWADAGSREGEANSKRDVLRT